MASIKSATDANVGAHQKDVLDLTRATKRRYSSALLRKRLEDDFSRASRELLASGRISPRAVDALTGEGNMLGHLLAGGFSNIVAVDLSEDELEIAVSLYRQSGVDFVQSEIVEYFLAHVTEFDFIHFNSLHHIADYIGALAPAVMALTPGGFLYIAEGERCGWLRLFFTKLDDHLFALSDDKKKWLGRVASRLGVNFDKRAANAWRLTREAEVHATNGLDFTAIVEELGLYGCDVIVDHRATYPQSRLAALLRFPIRKTRHLLIRKNILSK